MEEREETIGWTIESEWAKENIKQLACREDLAASEFT